MLKRLTGLSRSALNKTRKLLGGKEADPKQASRAPTVDAGETQHQGAGHSQSVDDTGNKRTRRRSVASGQTDGSTQTSALKSGNKGRSRSAAGGERKRNDSSTALDNAKGRNPSQSGNRSHSPPSAHAVGKSKVSRNKAVSQSGVSARSRRGKPRSESSVPDTTHAQVPAEGIRHKSVVKRTPVKVLGNPLVVPADEHSVTRNSIARSALKVLDKLHEAGHAAYLVGGGVRDALVGLRPKDFDVATDASPETIRALFRNSRIIGRRFRLVHVVFGRDIIEVATFRAAHDKGDGGEVGKAGRIVRDNVFGSIEEDACRRDFSVNALYYNIADGSVVDYVDGLADLDDGIFRLIGDPVTRCEEDPVRVLRAVRLAAKLEFDIEEKTLAAMQRVKGELRSTPPPRLFEEVLKLFQGGYALRSFHSVKEHGLLRYLFPLLDKRLQAGDDRLSSMLDAALENTDRRVAQGKPITPAYLLAFMLWPDVEEQAKQDCALGMTVNDALFAAADTVLASQLRIISIPRRFSGPMKEIWQMQPRLERLKGGRALKLIEDRRFRAAYDFLCLRATVDERLQDSAQWWTQVQTLPEDQRGDAANNRPLVMNIWPDKRGRATDGQASAECSDLEERFDEELSEAGKAPAGSRGTRFSGKNSDKSTKRASVNATQGAPVSHADKAAGEEVSGEAPASAKKPARKRRRRRRRKPGGDAAGAGSGGSSSTPSS